jgi:hypothetical protein
MGFLTESDFPHHFSKHSNNGDPRVAVSPGLASLPAMLHPRTSGESVLLSTASATAVCDGLLRMAHCLIVELPEPQLRDIRYTLEALLTRVNERLDSAEFDLSFNIGGLAIDPGNCYKPRLSFPHPPSFCRP